MSQTDVIIIGGGLVGMTLALALDAHGLTAAVVDSAQLETTLAPSFDGRTSAISSASARMLRTIGLGDALDGHGNPIETIRVIDRDAPRHLLFNTRDEADEGRGGPLGYMFENRRLRLALYDAGRKAAGITLHAPARADEIVRNEAGVTVRLDNGTELRAPLLIAADGRRSVIREQAGIRIAHWRYHQTAIITTISHELPHDNVAFEIFYETGPFAILPMTDDAEGRHRSAIVWTVEGKNAEATLKLSPRAIKAEIEKRMQGALGGIELIAPMSSYPLGFHNSQRYTDRRLVLVGDAAHGMHPIAGQGLNLGLRDVAALAQVLAESARLGLDLGDAQVLTRYERWRGLDNMMVLAATDVLNRVFAVRNPLFTRLRQAGVATVARITPLKRFFMAEARGETGDLPALLRGELA